MGLMVLQIAALVILSVLSKAAMPENDFRIIKRQDLLASDSDIFRDNSSKSFSQLLFDVARDQVVVGARDAIYRLSLRGLRTLERADWPAPQETTQLCQVKGQTAEDCHNYVKVLLSYGHKLFACGTNAFSPVCSWREIESIDKVLDFVPGVPHCPYNPHSNSTAVMAGTGEYYAGTPIDFTSSYTAICRSRGASLRDLGTLRTSQYDQKWLNEPQFVGSFEDDHYVYFVFREIAVEFMACGKTMYSRIARVCKNDAGGHNMMKDTWSTFLKARLNCSRPGDYPFHYDEVQGIEYLPGEGLLVATFTTNDNSIAGSAVCIYNMSDINAVFDGPFKEQKYPSQVWEPVTPSPQERERFKCSTDSRSGAPEYEYMRYHLMHDAIQPITNQPIYTEILERFTQITVDVTQTKQVKKQYVIFVATQKNDVIKLVALPELKGACLVEVWRLKDENGGFDIKKMQFVKETMSVYLGTEQAVVRISAQRCKRYNTKASCIAAADPYCGWDDGRELCLEATHHVNEAYFVQETMACPSGDTPVDGGWSSWSDWAPCEQDASQSPYDDKPDMCVCRTRNCDNPIPSYGGLPCKGSSIAVRNCTVHGGWSPWSAWSACSATCGIAVKSRRRGCVAPEPKHGGRVCVGLDVQELFCSQLPPCADESLAPIDGEWSEWSAWSPCTHPTATCGAGGRRQRRRSCTSPAPRRGGASCTGDAVEVEDCEMRPCENRKTAVWSPWINVVDNSSDGRHMEKRFKFTCKVSSEQIKLSLTKEESRHCSTNGCSQEEDGWSEWGPWEECSVPCGGGQQVRRRGCNSEDGKGCKGAADMVRPCNMQSCTESWSCWSEWSECTGSCGSIGKRTRSRQCVSTNGCQDSTAAIDTQLCVPNCAAKEPSGVWGDWSAWSPCNEGSRSRRRHCNSGVCAGPMFQVALCGDQEMDNELPIPAYSQNVEMASFVSLSSNDSMSIGSVIACVLTAFALGCLVCLAGVVFLSRRGRLPFTRRTRVPSSPHYITAKQNSYVTVPLKDVPRKAKRQPSFTGIGGSSGIVLSKSNNIQANNHNVNTPKLYPKAIANEYDTMGTLRRHSNLTNNRNNLDFDDDKFY